MNRLVSTLVLLVSLAVPLGTRAAEFPARLAGGLDAFVERGLSDWGIPGLAIGIVKDGELVLARGYGVRELGKPGAVDERTLFAVASNTKAFTAALLGILAAEGKLSLDDRVIDHLPAFRMHDPYVTRDIRIRDLLAHRSGLHTFGGDHLWIGNRLTRDEVVRRIAFLEPRAPFRARYQYQNLMFLVAGQVAAAVEGKSWDAVLRERILDPLGMEASSSSVRDLEGKENVATPHDRIDGRVIVLPYDDVDSVGPAASLNSNVVEMSRWMRMHLAGGVFDGERILPATLVREMQTVQTPVAVSPRTSESFHQNFAGYGLGWGLADYRGHKLVQHGGGLTGMISRQTLVPDLDLGVIVLSNLAPNSFPRALAYHVIDAYLDAPQTDWNAVYLERRRRQEGAEAAAESLRVKARAEGTRASLPFEEYAGIYANPLSGRAHVRLENDRLVFDYNPRHAGELEHWHHDTFRVTWRQPIFDMPRRAFVTFELDENGRVARLRTTFYQPIEFERVVAGDAR